MKKKHPITIILTEETHAALAKMAEKESRPVAQMARVIIEKAVDITEPTSITTILDSNGVRGSRMYEIP